MRFIVIVIMSYFDIWYNSNDIGNKDNDTDNENNNSNIDNNYSCNVDFNDNTASGAPTTGKGHNDR